MLKINNKYAEFPERYPMVIRTEGTIKKGEVVTVGGVEVRKGVDYIPQRGGLQGVYVYIRCRHYTTWWPTRWWKNAWAAT